MSDDQVEARAFAQSVAGVLGRRGEPAPAWTPGEKSREESPGLAAALDELGWEALAGDESLLTCAGLGAVELGRRLAPLRHVDRLLGGGPMVGELVRSLGVDRVAVLREQGVVVRRPVVRAEPVAAADGLEVHRVLEVGEPVAEVSPTALAAWRAACVGYLGGLGQGALELTVEYVRQRRAFGSTLAALGPVQQLLADAATAVGGVSLLAAEGPDVDALAYAGHAITDACAACHQVSGAIAFTLEYPLHRFTQRARAVATWNDDLVESLLQPPASARARRSSRLTSSSA